MVPAPLYIPLPCPLFSLALTSVNQKMLDIVFLCTHLTQLNAQHLCVQGIFVYITVAAFCIIRRTEIYTACAKPLLNRWFAGCPPLEIIWFQHFQQRIFLSRKVAKKESDSNWVGQFSTLHLLYSLNRNKNISSHKKNKEIDLYIMPRS